MTLGNKIKRARLEAGMTQAQLAGENITRNMLSLIENDNAEPSMKTIRYLADRLSLPVGYFLSEESDSFTYRKAAAMPTIRTRLRNRDYNTCIQLCTAFAGQEDDELHLILCECFTCTGLEEWQKQRFDSAKNAWETALHHARCTVYNTLQEETVCRFYLEYLNTVRAFIKNGELPTDTRAMAELSRTIAVNTPVQGDLLYNAALYAVASGKTDLARLLSESGLITNPGQNAHLHAVLLRAEGAVTAAIDCLNDIDTSSVDPVTLCRIWNDLEEMYTAQNDYDRAYRCHLNKTNLLASITAQNI